MLLDVHDTILDNPQGKCLPSAQPADALTTDQHLAPLCSSQRDVMWYVCRAPLCNPGLDVSGQLLHSGPNLPAALAFMLPLLAACYYGVSAADQLEGFGTMRKMFKQTLIPQMQNLPGWVGGCCLGPGGCCARCGQVHDGCIWQEKCSGCKRCTLLLAVPFPVGCVHQHGA